MVAVCNRKAAPALQLTCLDPSGPVTHERSPGFDAVTAEGAFQKLDLGTQKMQFNAIGPPAIHAGRARPGASAIRRHCDVTQRCVQLGCFGDRVRALIGRSFCLRPRPFK